MFSVAASQAVPPGKPSILPVALRPACWARAALFAAVCSAAGLASPAAWAINKCTLASGSVIYQQAPCANSANEQKMKVHDAVIDSAPAPRVKPAPVHVPAAPVARPSPDVPPAIEMPARTALDNEADQCFEWYRTGLRDPRGAYYRGARKEGRVVTVTIHATNARGGYVPKEAACEFMNGVMDQGWTKIQAERGGW
jgi:hypothetical protein